MSALPSQNGRSEKAEGPELFGADCFWLLIQSAGWWWWKNRTVFPAWSAVSSVTKRGHHERDKLILLHQPSGEEAVGVEAGGWRRKMGRESRRCVSEKTEEEKRCYGRAGESVKLSWSAQQLCHNSSFLGRQASGFTPERAATCNLLQSVALARPAEPSRTETTGMLRVSLRFKTEGGLHQSLPLQAGRESW